MHTKLNRWMMNSAPISNTYNATMAKTFCRYHHQIKADYHHGHRNAAAEVEEKDHKVSGLMSKSQKNIKHRKRASSFDASPNKHGLPSALSSKQRGSAPLLLQQSALGDFHDMGTRKLMTDLILTLNASFPDYDFANVRPSHFSKVPTSSALHRINERLSELAASEEHASNLLSNLWNAMDGCIALSECMVYSYVPTDATAEDDDPLNFLTQTLAGEDASSLWSFNYFFVNKHAKRIVLFTCVESILPQGDVVNEGGDFFVTKGMGYNTDASDVDFDLDPAADVAGGIPVATR
mmetsp:Transcript_23289/g.30361  ORF Transcript_23289/g.30361 Transcript_23289/m.30361 type:complete len:293 (+) Transcript_23289:254-1132(+)